MQKPTIKKIRDAKIVLLNDVHLGMFRPVRDKFEISPTGLSRYMKSVTTHSTEQQCIDHLVECAESLAKRILGQ